MTADFVSFMIIIIIFIIIITQTK